MKTGALFSMANICQDLNGSTNRQFPPNPKPPHILPKRLKLPLPQNPLQLNRHAGLPPLTPHIISRRQPHHRLVTVQLPGMQINNTGNPLSKSQPPQQLESRPGQQPQIPTTGERNILPQNTIYFWFGL